MKENKKMKQNNQTCSFSVHIHLKYKSSMIMIVSGIYYIIHVYLSIMHTHKVYISAVPMNVPHRLVPNYNKSNHTMQQNTLNFKYCTCRVQGHAWFR